MSIGILSINFSGSETHRKKCFQSFSSFSMQIILLLRLHEVTTTSLLIQLKIQCGKLKYDVPPNCWNWCEHLLCQHNKLFCSSVFPFQLLFVSLPSGTRDQLSLHRTLWAPHPSVSLSMALSLLYKINKWKSKFMLVFFSFHSPFFSLKRWQCIRAEESVVAPAVFLLCIWTSRAKSVGEKPQHCHHPPPHLL